MTAAELTPELVRGVECFLAEYARVTAGDYFVIAYAPDSRESAVWLTAGLRKFDVTVRLIPMRPLIDQGFADRLSAVLPAREDSFRRLVIVTLERDTMSHFDPLREVWARFGTGSCQIIRVISASLELFTEAMRLTPSDLSARNATLLSSFLGRQELHIRSDSGTDLTATVDSDMYDWISNRGIWRPSGFTILPAGEIATYPAGINGTLVADGAVNCNIISRLDMRLQDTPAIVTVRDGVAVDFQCANPAIEELIGLSFQRENGRKVGELGFGTNTGITRFIPHNSHINERRAGVHLGFGQHNQDFRRVSYFSDIHLDLITNGARITIAGAEGDIDLADLAVGQAEHPVSVRDEDITGDCCGLSYGQIRGMDPSGPGAEACSLGA